MLTHRMIEAFRAVILHGGISKAASAMHISQPAVSRLIIDLEDATGLPLFERRNRQVYPTEQALDLYEEVHRTYIALERISVVAKSIQQRGQRWLRLSSMPVLGMRIIPKTIACFREQFPQSSVSLQVSISSNVVQDLNMLSSDLGFFESSFNISSVAMGQEYRLRSVCIFPAGHRFASLDVVQIEDLHGEAFVSLGEYSRLRLRLDAMCTSAEVERVIVAEAPLAATVCALVNSGCGVAVVDPISASDYVPLGLASRPFNPELEFSFCTASTPRAAGSAMPQQFQLLFDQILRQSIPASAYIVGAS